MSQVQSQSPYRWVIVAAGGVLGCVAIGAMFSLPVLLLPISKNTGWSVTGVSSAMTIGFLALALASMIWGSLSDRFGPRLVLLAKSTYVWLDQLSKKYGLEVKRLDEIPDEELDELGVSISTRYLPVRVIDVVPGWDSHQPVRFLLQTEAGFEVFVDVHMTDTNVSDKLRQYNRFATAFLTSPPQD